MKRIGSFDSTNIRPERPTSDEQQPFGTGQRVQQIYAALVADEKDPAGILPQQGVVRDYLTSDGYEHHADNERAITAWCIANDAPRLLQVALIEFGSSQLTIENCSDDNVVAGAVRSAHAAGVTTLNIAHCKLTEPSESGSGAGSDSEGTFGVSSEALSDALRKLTRLSLADWDLSSECLRVIFEGVGQSEALEALALANLPAFGDDALMELAKALPQSKVQTLTLTHMAAKSGAELAAAVVGSGVRELRLDRCDMDMLHGLLSYLVDLPEHVPMPLHRLHISGGNATDVQAWQQLVQLRNTLQWKFMGLMTVSCRIDNPAAEPAAQELSLTTQPHLTRRCIAMNHPDFVRMLSMFLGAVFSASVARQDLRMTVEISDLSVRLTILRLVAADPSGDVDHRSLLALRRLNTASRDAWDRVFDRVANVSVRSQWDAVRQIAELLSQGRTEELSTLAVQLRDRRVIVPPEALEQFIDQAKTDEELLALSTFLA